MLCFSLCLFCSCGKVSSSSLMAHVITEIGNVPASRLIYYSDASPETVNYLEKEQCGKIYYDSFDINALCLDYSVMIANCDTPYEIHILRARARSDLEEIMSALYIRRDLIQQKNSAEYNTAGYEKTGKSAQVFSKGNYGFLLVTDDNQQAEKIIRSYL